MIDPFEILSYTPRVTASRLGLNLLFFIGRVKVAGISYKGSSRYLWLSLAALYQIDVSCP